MLNLCWPWQIWTRSGQIWGKLVEIWLDLIEKWSETGRIWKIPTTKLVEFRGLNSSILAIDRQTLNRGISWYQIKCYRSENEKTDETCYNTNLNRAYHPNMEADTTHSITPLDLKKCFSMFFSTWFGIHRPTYVLYIVLVSSCFKLWMSYDQTKTCFNERYANQNWWRHFISSPHELISCLKESAHSLKLNHW